jgi:hypothetical protein
MRPLAPSSFAPACTWTSRQTLDNMLFPLTLTHAHTHPSHMLCGLCWVPFFSPRGRRISEGCRNTWTPGRQLCGAGRAGGDERQVRMSSTFSNIVHAHPSSKWDRHSRTRSGMHLGSSSSVCRAHRTLPPHALPQGGWMQHVGLRCVVLRSSPSS